MISSQFWILWSVCVVIIARGASLKKANNPISAAGNKRYSTSAVSNRGPPATIEQPLLDDAAKRTSNSAKLFPPIKRAYTNAEAMSLSNHRQDRSSSHFSKRRVPGDVQLAAAENHDKSKRMMKKGLRGAKKTKKRASATNEKGIRENSITSATNVQAEQNSSRRSIRGGQAKTEKKQIFSSGNHMDTELKYDQKRKIYEKKSKILGKKDTKKRAQEEV